MVDLVGRRNATYIKQGSYVLYCYHEELVESSFLLDLRNSGICGSLPCPRSESTKKYYSSYRKNNPHNQIGQI
eukprot:Awhi_evm1s13325